MLLKELLTILSFLSVTFEVEVEAFSCESLMCSKAMKSSTKMDPPLFSKIYKSFCRTVGKRVVNCTGYEKPRRALCTFENKNERENDSQRHRIFTQSVLNQILKKDSMQTLTTSKQMLSPFLPIHYS